MKLLSLIAGAMLLALASGSAAFAQSSTIAVGDIYSAFLPYLVAIIGAVVTVLVGWLLSLAKTKLGISIDDSMRDSLQTALRNGAGLALNSLGNNLAGKTIDVKSAAVAAAVTYVAKNAPDAMAHFGLTPDAVAEKIVAYLPQVANTTTAAQT